MIQMARMHGTLHATIEDVNLYSDFIFNVNNFFLG
jgi:hypothetical protein